MTKRPHAVPLTRLVLDGLSQALTHAETMMAPDPETFGPQEWRAWNAADRWLRDQLKRRSLERQGDAT